MVRVEFTNTRLSMSQSHLFVDQERIKAYTGYTLTGGTYYGKYDNYVPVISIATLENSKHKWFPSVRGQPYINQRYCDAILEKLDRSSYLFVYVFKGKLKTKVLSPNQITDDTGWTIIVRKEGASDASTILGLGINPDATLNWVADQLDTVNEKLPSRLTKTKLISILKSLDIYVVH